MLMRTNHRKLEINNTENNINVRIPTVLTFKLDRLVGGASENLAFGCNNVEIISIYKKTTTLLGGTTNERIAAGEITILSIDKRNALHTYSDYQPELQIGVSQPVLSVFKLKSEVILVKPTNIFSFYNTKGNGITVWWESNSVFHDKFIIYSSSAPFTESNLPPNPIIVSKEYIRGIDTNPLPIGSTRYYMVGVNKGDTTVLSDLHQYTHTVENTYGNSPRVIGEFYNGGYYIGNIQLNNGEKYSVLVSRGSAEALEKSRDSNNPTVPIDDNNSYVDGKFNTENMVGYGDIYSPVFPASRYCSEYSDGTYDDWYIPSKNELDLFPEHIDPYTTVVPEFMFGSSDQIKLIDGYVEDRFIPGIRASMVAYLSSTHNLSYNYFNEPIITVWARHFNTDLTDVFNRYDEEYYKPDLNFSNSFLAHPTMPFTVRPVRRELISE